MTKSMHSTSSDIQTKDETKCLLDRALVNADTLPLMKDVGLSIFASACSKNRGAFVLHPPDGKTYGCLAFPEDVLEMAGVEVPESSINPNTSRPIFSVENVEDILKHHQDGNLTSADVVNILDFLVDNVYQSTPDVEVTVYACDVSGLVTLKCDTDDIGVYESDVSDVSDASSYKKTPIRSVTLSGVFTPALWATGGVELSLDEAAQFYTNKDFRHMKKLGLNTVQIPVPTKMFSDDYKNAIAWQNVLLDILYLVRTEGLDVILLLDDGSSPPEDVSKSVENAAIFASDYNAKHSDTIIVALTLPAKDSALLEAATTAAPDINVWIPTKGEDFTLLRQFSSATGVSLELSHTVTVADVASSSSQEDRAKLFYHETMACIARAPLEYSSCYQGMPVMVSSGFDLAVDDCHLRGISSKFHDYGQCDRFNETVDSPWWKDRRYSFAARQLYAYEKGMGWSFAAWKLWDSDPDAIGILDTPAKLLALQEVVAAGIMPSLFGLDEPITYPLSNNSSPVGLACLNPPANDYILGDATLAPTPAPPPDCGNGWWNFETEKCDYWIPPTPAPTPPCPACSNETVICPPVGDFTVVTASPENITLPDVQTKGTGAVAIESFLAGAVLSLIVCFIVSRVLGLGNKRREYEEVPTNGSGSYQAAA